MDEITLILVAIFVLFLLLCFSISALLYTCGLLSSVDVGTGAPPIKDVVVAYKFAKGPYKYAGDLFNEVARVMPDFTPIGIYYDDPKEVPSDKLRYAVGGIISEGKVKIEKDLIKQLESEGFKLVFLPEVSHCVNSSFPYVNTLSILVAVWKVYPCLGRYIQERKLCAYPMLEVYQKDTIQFMAPLSKQDDFFVEEAKQADSSRDDSLLDDSYNGDGSPSFCDESPASSCSRSVSSFSYSSKRLLEAYTDDESDDAKSGRDADETSPTIQDKEVTSSIDVRASKAHTNLLEDDEEVGVHGSEENASVSNNDSANDSSSSPAQMTGLSDSVDLHDSGIASGRTSVVPGDSATEPNKSLMDPGDDSSSSFEEINMDETADSPHH